MEKKLNKFFTSTLFDSLENLKADSKAEWGTMTPNKMIKHLIQSNKMMHLGITTLIIKEKHIEKSIAFLYSDKPISRGIEIPKDIGYNFEDGISENIKELKSELINSTNIMDNFLTENTNFKSIHPFFGELNSEQWLLFQRKHFKHHLSQFDLL